VFVRGRVLRRYREVAAILARHGQFAGSPLVRVPRVFWGCTERQVLTMESVSGIRIDDVAALTAAWIDTRKVARTSARVLLEAVFLHGFFHADPHPGNVLVQSDGSIVLLDFGMVGELNEELRFALNRLLFGVVRRDSALLLGALIDVGLVVPPEARRAFRRDLIHLLDRYYGVGLREVSVGWLVDDMAATARRHGLAFPADLALLGKTVAMYEGVGRSLDPDFNFAELAEPFVRDSLHALYSPAAVATRGARSAVDAASLALEVPGQVRRILRQVEYGDFEVRIRRDEINMALDGFGAIVNRLAASIVGAAIIISLAVLMGVYHPPGWQLISTILFIVGPAAAASSGDGRSSPRGTGSDVQRPTGERETGERGVMTGAKIAVSLGAPLLAVALAWFGPKESLLAELRGGVQRRTTWGTRGRVAHRRRSFRSGGGSWSAAASAVEDRPRPQGEH